MISETKIHIKQMSNCDVFLSLFDWIGFNYLSRTIVGGVLISSCSINTIEKVSNDISLLFLSNLKSWIRWKQTKGNDYVRSLTYVSLRKKYEKNFSVVFLLPDEQQ